MINFILKMWTAIEVIMWLKNIRDKEAQNEDDIHNRDRANDTVRTKNRSGRSSVLDDVPFEEE